MPETAAAMTAAQVKTACTDLEKLWSKRGTKMKEWHRILRLQSSSTETNMEDVVSNDPRTAYNLALHLLTSSVISHAIPTESLDAAQVSATGDVQKAVTKEWKKIETNYRQRGRQSWLRECVGTMLDCGWYAVFAIPLQDKVVAEIWHPAETFPEFGDEGLIACAHIYTLSARAANQKVKTNVWNVSGKIFDAPVKLYDLYIITDSGVVANATVLDEYLVKSLTGDSNLTRIPVFISPVSGLSDRGVLAEGDIWQENWGESIVAVNAGINKNYDDMLTFLQQILRDVATPRWLEKSTGDVPIMKPEDVFKRGAVFRGSPNDSIDALDVPTVPMEIQSMLFNYQNMKQRGEFPYVLYGNLQQQLAGYAISQIASAALQVLTPYHAAIKGLLSDIDNFWLESMIAGKTKLADFKMPKLFDKTAQFEIDYTIEIPGYLTQRATLARMLNPEFTLSITQIMSKLFPEIQDAAREQARAREDKAMTNPIALTVNLITGYRKQANLHRKIGDQKTAALYDLAANGLQAKLGGQQQVNTQKPNPKQNRSIMPNEEVAPVEGMAEEAGNELGG
jgi:hypothetical protein